MRRLKIYLETTIWNFYFAEDAPDKQATTQTFFGQLDQYDLFISELVLREILKTKNPEKQAILLELVNKYKPTILTIDKDIENLAEKYITENVLTDKHREDAQHISVAAVNEMDLLVSWNMRDIVRLKTRQGVNAIHTLKGYKYLEIVNPEEIVNYD